MRIFLFIATFILSSLVSTGVFAANEVISTGTSFIVLGTENSGLIESDLSNENEGLQKNNIAEEKKDREKTMNDINTFLIESYKLKIDRILSNLNISLERITNNNPTAQAKLLEKIRGDISIKIQVINSHNISENRKKILSSIFGYIQENLDAKISRLVQQK